MSPKNTETTYWSLMGYVRPYRWVFMLAVLGAMVDAAMRALFIYSLSPILEHAFSEQNALWIKWLPLYVIGIFLIRSVGNFSASYGFTWVGRKVINDLRRLVFRQYLVLPQAYFDRNTAGGLISRVTYDIEQMANGVSKNIILIIREALSIILYLAVMFSYSWQLATIAFLVFPIIGLAIRLINKRFRRIGHGIQDSIAHITQTVEEVVKGNRIVKVFRGSEKETQKFAKNIKQNRQLQVKNVATRESLSSFNLMMVSFMLALIMTMAAKTGMSAEDFMSFMTAMLALIPTIKNLSTVFGTIQTTLAAADSVMEVLDEVPEKDEGQLTMDAKQVTLQFDQAGFSYDDEHAALSDVDLQINAGQSVAFVGSSGGGKSTLVNLVPRFYEVSSGAITINGQDIKDFTLASLREHIAMVSQDVILFNDTVRNNIAYGAQSDRSDEAIKRAAEQANAIEFIEKLPAGFDTMLGDNGTRLSGGQRQRIAIARAILKDAPLLILDEATSALDSESEQKIQAALSHLMKERTTLVIAHRLSTIEDVDQVVVMDQGQVAEVGNHQTLMAKGGIYRQLQEAQKSQHGAQNHGD